MLVDRFPERSGGGFGCPHNGYAEGRPNPDSDKDGHRDIPLFVEHCEAVAAGIDIKRRWLDEQGRRGLSVVSS